MRVTNRQVAEAITRDIYKNHQLLLDAQIRVSSGKKILRPSDDPIGMRKVLDYRKILSSIDQYNRNIDHGKTQIELTETALDEIDSMLTEAKKWALEYGSGNNDDLRETALINVQSIYESIMDLANTKIGDSYIFGGHVTNTAPFSRDADGIPGTADDYTASYGGDDGDITVLVSDNVEVKINATGRDIFDVGGVGGGTDIFASLEALINALDTNDPAAAFAEVTNISNGIEQVQDVATESAVYYGRLESAESHLIQYKSNIQDMLGETEDVDMAQAIVELQLQETAYLTCLESAAKIIQPSLVDFVK